MIDQDFVKHNYPQPAGKTYLNTSSSGLVSRRGIQLVQEFNEALFADNSTFIENFYSNEIGKIREIASSFLDASIHELAFVPNFSYGLNAVLPAISERKRVLLYRNDYPSLIIPFQLNDYEITWLEETSTYEIDLNSIESIMGERKIDLLAISHIQYLTGHTTELEQLQYLCKKYDVLLLIDATQSLGAFPFSFKSSGVNILITSNYKWMNAGYGTGILCIDEETMEKYQPKIGGFNSYKYVNEDWDYRPGIASYEPGHLNMAGLVMLKEAILNKMKIGIENIENHNYQLLQTFTDKVKDLNFKVVVSAKHCRNIVSLHGNKQLEDHLLNNGIVVKLRENMIRIGIHFYNTDEDIMRLLDGLQSFRK